MHVDGFRFDLAASLGRGDERLRSPLGVPGGRRPGPGALPGQADRRALGRRARAATRSATSRRAGASGTAATATRCATSGAASRARLPTSPRASPAPRDLYGDGGRRPTASVNFVTVHDGFTLADLVAYDRKHNEANGEDNRDGTDDNRSWNCGAEGPTGRRRRSSRCARASSATCWPRCCSPQGVPHDPGRRRARAAARAATTTPTARTGPSPGSTGNGRPGSVISPTSRPDSAACAAGTRPSAAGSSSAADRPRGTDRTTSPGSGPTASRWPPPTGARATPGPSWSP